MDVLEFTDIFFPNEVEAVRITRTRSAREAADRLSEFAEMVVVKCGPKGAVGKYGDQILEVPTFTSLKPIDTTGAGDSFNAGFIYGFLNGFDFKSCIIYGNACGSISVTRIGGASACPGLEEVRRLIEREA
jgi:sugar/nucleoside kinase (ribokinase family)